MMLKENTIFGEVDKVAIAIARMREFEPPEGYYLAFSGGKDSICIYQLAKMSGVKFDAHYHITGLDQPELVRFIMREYPAVTRERPRKTMWRLIPEKLMPPTRLVRYCCEELKEHGGSGRIVLTGIRAKESNRRAKRKMFEICNKNATKKYLHAIIDWSESDVWEFIKSSRFKYPYLYDEGYRRLGCIGCPMNTAAAAADLNRYPRFKALYLRAFDKMLKERDRRGKITKWKTAQEVMDWWLSGGGDTRKDSDEKYCTLFGFGEMAEEVKDEDKEVKP